MGLFKKLKTIIAFEYFRFNEANFERYLKKRGVKLGTNIYWGNIRTINIDTSRPSLIEIGNDVRINTGMSILTHDFPTWVFRNVYQDFVNSSGRIKIGNNIYFGQYCTILKGVTIGDNCVVGFGSIVTRDIPSNSIVAGRPAKVICSLDQYYQKRKEKCVEEAFEYANSIQERFHRRPRIEDFWEEFPLFMDGDQTHKKLPIERQLGTAYDHYRKNHKAIFNGFEDFLKHAGID